MRALRSDWSLECGGERVRFRRDRNGRDRDAAADSERAPSAQLTGRVALDVVAVVARRSPSVVLCVTIDS